MKTKTKMMGIGDLVKTRYLDNDVATVVKVLGKKWTKIQIGNVIFMEHNDDLELISKAK